MFIHAARAAQVCGINHKTIAAKRQLCAPAQNVRHVSFKRNRCLAEKWSHATDSRSGGSGIARSRCDCITRAEGCMREPHGVGATARTRPGAQRASQSARRTCGKVGRRTQVIRAKSRQPTGRTVCPRAGLNAHLSARIPDGSCPRKYPHKYEDCKTPIEPALKPNSSRIGSPGVIEA